MKIQLQNQTIPLGPAYPLLLIAGPCAIENLDLCLYIADFMKKETEKRNIPYIFKASFDKANRSSISSFRGPGIEEGLRILETVRDRTGVPVISDIHLPSQADAAAEVLDMIQIPAFLCRQTDLLSAAARTGKPVNVKKGQFLAPWDMQNVISKLTQSGAREILLTERGASFGYNNLVVDFRSLPILSGFGHPVIFDATHSVQLPGGSGTQSSGQREFAPVLARSAVAAGADGIFIETHPEPEKALCDGANSLHLAALPALLDQLCAIKEILGGTRP
ncbi:3-deoxy-8-phosphooctulonate synthase [Desulfobotulus sp. H1]|uniref:2-dehydro-3-deoxyphosphooctonate aldolase n=1 Tax=Desulfobotulus pelophilus TaxID=2823377 RepID=A0ABT3N5U6_9BACT|nr:3-deoxy-8-phosphooctulonate synthase [Desulfobotulus pelophilus]MCW7752829.1 3-deoxy-8-phosphooctulonate synthase [Desulfobotulus pelophilus]